MELSSHKARPSKSGPYAFKIKIKKVIKVISSFTHNGGIYSTLEVDERLVHVDPECLGEILLVQVLTVVEPSHRPAPLSCCGWCDNIVYVQLRSSKGN